MPRRFVAIWFMHLLADRQVRRHPDLKGVSFVLATPERGRMMVKSVSPEAHQQGIRAGMVAADCRAIQPGIPVYDYTAGQEVQLLTALGEWCIRYTPIVAIDPPEGLLLDASGCPHLWGGEQQYIDDITTRLGALGYHVRVGMADTAGAAWAVARYSKGAPIVSSFCQADALLPLPPAALRLDPLVVERMSKLGMKLVSQFMHLPRRALRRRFGEQTLLRIDQALGQEQEVLVSIRPQEPYQERLPCLEPIRTAPGIEVALRQLLDTLCHRLADEGKGLRRCIFRGYRIDGNIQQVEIGTVRASRNAVHLFRLFEEKISSIAPDLGIELFMLEAPVVEDVAIEQEVLWHTTGHHDDVAVSELLDRVAVKVGQQSIHRYLPAEHYWPERSFRQANSLTEQSGTGWRTDLPRPLHLLLQPELIEVTVPIPDYPPMLFIYRGKLHQVKKADGPERIEQEWWLNQGLYRDYYCVEDEHGARYWVFRSGSYASEQQPQWFVHGFFA